MPKQEIQTFLNLIQSLLAEKLFEALLKRIFLEFFKIFVTYF